MSDSPLLSAPVHASMAIGAFAESLVRGRRVAIFGDATFEVGDLLLARGARSVQLFDPDPGRVAEASARRGKASGPRPIVTLMDDEPGVRDGGCELVLVPDLSLFDDWTQVVRRARRLLSINGVALFAAPNTDAEQFLLPPSRTIERSPTYYDLFDTVSVQFPEVKMLGQAPFVGYSIVDFSESDPEVAVDTSVLEEPEVPEWFIAIAGDRALEFEPYSLIGLPLSEVAHAVAVTPEPATLPPPPPTPRWKDGTSSAAASVATGAMPAPAPVPAVTRTPTQVSASGDEVAIAFAEARTRTAMLGAENERLREELAEARSTERTFDQAKARVVELEGEVARLAARLTDASRIVRRDPSDLTPDARVTGLQKKLGDADARCQKLELRTRDAEARAHRLEERLRDAEAWTKKVESEAATAAELAAAEAASVRERDAETLRAMEAQLASVTASRDALELRVEELEQQISGFEQEKAKWLADSRTKAQAGAPRAGELEAELTRLEEQLRERGREVARLNRDLREVERIGRELVFELGDLRAATNENGGAAGPPPEGGPTASPTRDSVTRGDAPMQAESRELAERAARTEADLVAASWRVSQLERELALRASPSRSSTSARERELAHALSVAQRQLAEALCSGVAPSEAVTDGLALLEQLERPMARQARGTPPDGAPPEPTT